MHQFNYCSQKYTRKYNLKVHIEMMHSEDNINNRNNSTLSPLAQPLLPAPPPPPTQEDYTYKMYDLFLPKLPYSDSTLPPLAPTPLLPPPPPTSPPHRTSNLKKSIKNQTLRNIKKKNLRKIKMMIKKNVSLGLDIYTLRRNVDRLGVIHILRHQLLGVGRPPPPPIVINHHILVNPPPPFNNCHIII